MKQNFKKVLLSPKLKYFDNIILAYTDDVFVPKKLDNRIRPVSLYSCPSSLYAARIKSLLNEHTLLLYCRSCVSDKSNYDVSIGFNDDRSPPSGIVISLIEEGFNRHNYKVQVEESQLNLMLPETGFQYSSLIIEVNKNICVDGRSVAMKETLEEIYYVLLSHSELI